MLTQRNKTCHIIFYVIDTWYQFTNAPACIIVCFSEYLVAMIIKNTKKSGFDFVCEFCFHKFDVFCIKAFILS